jgi:UDP-glucose 6-dehydrogenase
LWGIVLLDPVQVPHGREGNPFFIFGGDKKDTSECVSLSSPVTGPTKTYRQTTAREAEMAGHIENCFYATKVTFCYDMATLCEKAGLDWNEIRELWLLDPRLNPMHTAVFPENNKPYSGKCFPKDMKALLQLRGFSGLRTAGFEGHYSSERRHRQVP